MLNYLKSEIYRLKNMKGTYIRAFLCLLLPILFILLLRLAASNTEYYKTDFIYGSVVKMLGAVVFWIPFICVSLFSDEWGNKTFKNSVASGLSRRSIYIGKLLMAIIGTIFYAILLIVSFVFSTELLVPNKEKGYLAMFLQSFIRVLPLFLICVVIATAFLFIFQKKSSVYLSYYFFTIFLSGTLSVVHMFIKFPSAILKIFPDWLIGENFFHTPGQIAYTWILLAIYIWITVMVCGNIFEKRDI